MKCKIHNLVASVISENGFVPVSKYVYVSKVSSEEIEHFIYVHPVFSERKDDSYIHVSYGFRILRCDVFALNVMQSCNELEGKFKSDYNVDTGSLFNIDVGFLGVEKSKNWNIWIDDLTEENFINEFRKKFVDIDAFKSNVIDKKQMFYLLISDDEPFRWFRCNPVFRVSAIIFLGLELGYKPSYLVELIESHSEILEVQGGIRDLRKFLKCVFDLTHYHVN